MYLRSLYLYQFRCYQEAFFEFSQGINVILGPNAKGKTSLLEALYLLITGRSFRTSLLQELVQQNKSHFCIEATFVKNGIEQILKISSNGKEHKLTYNSSTLPTTSALLGLLQGTLMIPDDLLIVKGAPSGRRAFLDMHMAQIDPLYVHHLTRYLRALRQRNVLLRTKQVHSIKGWEQEMASSAAYLSWQRTKVLEDIQGRCIQFHRLFAEEGPLKFQYTPSIPSQNALDQLRNGYLELYDRLRHKELLFGSTLSGPQKEDFSILFGDKEARSYASEGQQRSCTMAMRLAEWERLKHSVGETPLLLVDDIGASLDKQRRQRLMSQVLLLGQVFLTTNEELAWQEGNYKLIHL